MKQTKAYRAALAQLADAIAQQDPAEVMMLEVGMDLSDVLERRHPDFEAAMNRASEERAQHRKQRGKRQ
jgi:hypothetical protein